MDKSNYQEIEKLIEQNSIITGFDMYYLGFFSYYVVQKLSLEDTFKHLSNIISLHNDHLITNEVKIDLLIKMLSNKIDFSLLHIVHESEGDGSEEETKKVLTEYFKQIMKLIPKYNSINKFELFYLGRFHAIYPSYKISELFQHINNINTLVSEDLIDEETQIDFLLKILNKKLTTKKSAHCVLNIPKDSDSAAKDETSSQIKQEPKHEESAENRSQQNRQAASNIVNLVPAQEAPKNPVVVQNPVASNVENIEESKQNQPQPQPQNAEKEVEREEQKESVVENMEVEESNQVEPKEQELVSNQPELNGASSPHKEDREVSVEHEENNSKDQVLEEEEEEHKEKSHHEEEEENLEGDTNEQLIENHMMMEIEKEKEAREKEKQKEEKESKHSEEIEHEVNQPAETEEKPLEESREETEEHVNLPANTNNFAPTLMMAGEGLDRQQTNITEHTEKDQEEGHHDDEEQSHRERMSEAENREKEDEGRMELEEHEEKSVTDQNISADLEPKGQNQSEHNHEEMSVDLERKGTKESRKISDDLSADLSAGLQSEKHTEHEHENENEVHSPVPEKPVDSLNSLSGLVGEERSGQANDVARKESNQSADLSADLEVEHELDPRSNDSSRNINRQGTQGNSQEQIMEILSSKPSATQESHTHTQEMRAMYPQGNMKKNMGTLDEILNNLLEDDNSSQQVTPSLGYNQMQRANQGQGRGLVSQRSDISEGEKPSQALSSIPEQPRDDEHYTFANHGNIGTFDNPRASKEDTGMEIEEPKRTSEENKAAATQESSYSRADSGVLDASQPHAPSRIVIQDSQFSQPDQSYILRYKKNSPTTQMQRLETSESAVEDEKSEKPVISLSQDSMTSEHIVPKQESTQFRALLDAPTLADNVEEEEYFPAPPARTTAQKPSTPEREEIEYKVEDTTQIDSPEHNRSSHSHAMKLETQVDNLSDHPPAYQASENRVQSQESWAAPSLPGTQEQPVHPQPIETAAPSRAQLPVITVTAASQSQPNSNNASQENMEEEKVQVPAPVPVQVQQAIRKENQPAAVTTQSVNPNSCSICRKDLSIKPTKKIEICKDTFHEECLRQFLEDKIEAKDLKIECPKQGCNKTLRLIDLMDFLDQDYLEDYVIFTLKIYIDKNNGVSCCPTPGCPYAFVKENQKQFQCPVCKKQYCLNCKMDWHQGVACEYYEQKKRREKKSEGEESSKYKKCPSCSTWVPKVPGVNVMHCQCGSKFCYTCGKEREERHCECLRNQSFRPVVHPKLYHEAMQTPESFKNFNQNESERNTNTNNANARRMEVEESKGPSRPIHSYKPEATGGPGRTAPHSQSTQNVSRNTVQKSGDSDMSYEEDDLSYKGGNSMRNSPVHKPNVAAAAADDDDDLSFKASPVGRKGAKDDDDDISYKGSPKKEDDDDDLSYKASPAARNDRKAQKDDEISYKGSPKREDEEDDISYTGSPKRKNQGDDDDISYKGSVNSDISA